MADLQTQRAFQKQEGIFQNSKKLLAKKTSKGVRYWKEVGLGFKVPKEAIEGHYIDKKSNLKRYSHLNQNDQNNYYQKRLFTSMLPNIIDMRRDIEMFQCTFHRAFGPVKEGDIVVCGQCRPLSKTVRFNVLKVIPNEIIGNVRKQFVLF
ncbi:unnamed protein product (macronuclear) [Paramecium tetraurelia]|uniref:Small ribosomal subunit protein uS17 N-terminal domain-containing protein n=1 Tax=Paramecium tetraurelia TaxID=5888 RepID=A0DC44_PARTE|nr:uncharacterized protein GSPATT00015488001 [Paramecium tetraurelia]CAK80611.1 unnamed protein product [Paramecium tetraurelia]|eukprot:XP_001448008.1 hypothetical protein (macronuclear) [Paramecium tetraurelia strain d4-2]